MTHFTLKYDNDFLLIHIYVDQCYDFFGEIEVNPTSPVSSPLSYSRSWTLRI
jgi:hypothetical protein